MKNKLLRSEINKSPGVLTISLDMELLWGMLDLETKSSYGDAICGGRKAIDQILRIFKTYDIHATWGVVGMMLADTKEDLNKYLPKNKPQYQDIRLSSYEYFGNVGMNESEDPYHYGQSIVKKIMLCKYQEIGSHTFSHFYCECPKINDDSFADDMKSDLTIMDEKIGVKPISFIFPRNNFNNKAIGWISEAGIKIVRGNPKSYAYNHENLFSRGIRLIDTYINICGMKCYRVEKDDSKKMNITRYSRFLRPYNEALFFLEPFKIQCIKRQMRYAAKNGLVFHLWWHPHNFGRNTDKMLEQLETLLSYYRELSCLYGMISLNMSELSQF